MNDGKTFGLAVLSRLEGRDGEVRRDHRGPPVHIPEEIAPQTLVEALRGHVARSPSPARGTLR